MNIDPIKKEAQEAFYKKVIQTGFEGIERKKKVLGRRLYDQNRKLREMFTVILKEAGGPDEIKKKILSAAKNGLTYSVLFSQYDPIPYINSILPKLKALIQQYIDDNISERFIVEYSTESESNYYPIFFLEWKKEWTTKKIPGSVYKRTNAMPNPRKTTSNTLKDNPVTKQSVKIKDVAKDIVVYNKANKTPQELLMEKEMKKEEKKQERLAMIKSKEDARDEAVKRQMESLKKVQDMKNN